MFSLESIHWSSQTYVGPKSYVFFLRHWAEPPAGGWVIPLKLSPERRKLGEVQQVAEQVFRFLNSAEDFQVGASGPARAARWLSMRSVQWCRKLHGFTTCNTGKWWSIMRLRGILQPNLLADPYRSYSHSYTTQSSQMLPDSCANIRTYHMPELV